MVLIITKRDGEKTMLDNFVYYVKQKTLKIDTFWNRIQDSKNNENSCRGSIIAYCSINDVYLTILLFYLGWNCSILEGVSSIFT